MNQVDRQEFEWIYHDEWTTNKLYLNRLNIAIENNNNVYEVLKILSDAKKIKNNSLLDTLYKEIKSNSDLYSKIIETLKYQLSLVNQAKDSLERLQASRFKDRWSRNRLSSLNKFDLENLIKNKLTSEIYKKLPNTDLAINTFDINDKNSPFNYLLELQIDLTFHLETLKKLELTNTKSSLQRLKEVFFK